MNILAIIPVTNKIIRKSALEITSYAAEFAKNFNGNFTAFVLGDTAEEELNRLALYGTEKVLQSKGAWTQLLDNQTWSKAIADVAVKVSADLLIFPENAYGKALAPAVSIHLDAAYFSGVDGLPQSIAPLRFARKAFSGKAIASVSSQSKINVVTLSPNSFGIKENIKTLQHEAWEPGDTLTPGISLIERKMAEGKLLMSEADIIVSGGRGMKGAAHWGPLEEFAHLLGAATACSRPVSDEGWRPHHEHVGQTGKVVAPNLYIACGISGAVQHLAGVSSSKVLVAINKDPEAPIFSAADYGIIGDVHEVLPKLTEAMKELQDQ